MRLSIAVLAFLLAMSIGYAQYTTDDIFISLDRSELWLSQSIIEYTIKNPTNSSFTLDSSKLNLSYPIKNVNITSYSNFLYDGKNWVPLNSKSISKAETLKIRQVTKFNLQPSVSIDPVPSLMVDGKEYIQSKWVFQNLTCFQNTNVTFDNSWNSETLSNFPVPIFINSTNFNITAGLNGTNLQIFDPNGTVLSRDIERWNTSGESIVWTKTDIDALSDTDYIQIYYQCSSDTTSPSLVFDANYSMVLHLNETQNTTIFDISPYGNNLTIAAGSSTQNITQIDGGMETYGATDYVSGSTFPISGASPFTFSAWVNTKSCSATRGIGGWGETAGVGGANRIGFSCNYPVAGNFGQFGGGAGDIDSGFTFNNGNWTYIVMNYNGSGFRFYKNGVEGSFTAAAMGGVTSTTFRLGWANYGTKFYFDGFIDQLEISNLTRSSSWINASFLMGLNAMQTYGGPVGNGTVVSLPPLTENKLWFRLNSTFEHFLSEIPSGDSPQEITISANDEDFTCTPAFEEQGNFTNSSFIEIITAETYWDKSGVARTMDLEMRAFRLNVTNGISVLIGVQRLHEIMITSSLLRVDFLIEPQVFFDKGNQKLSVTLCAQKTISGADDNINFHYNGGTSAEGNSSLTKLAAIHPPPIISTYDIVPYHNYRKELGVLSITGASDITTKKISDYDWQDMLILVFIILILIGAIAWIRKKLKR